MAMKWISSAVISLAALLCVAAEEPSRMLFLGSSSTYFHDMPGSVANLLTKSEAVGEVTHHWVGEPGTWTHVYLDDGYRVKSGLPEEFAEDVLGFIRASDFRWVSIQVAAGKWAEWQRAIPLYASAARGAGSELLLYEQGWKKEVPKVLDSSPLLQIAIQQDLRIVPCSSAWAQVQADHPKKELHDRFWNEEKGEVVLDTTHPGILGNYLNQACFLAAILERSPVGVMPERIPHDIRMAHEKSKLPDGVTLVGTEGGTAVVELDPALAEYLQKVAWQTYEVVEKKRREAKE